MKNNKQKGEILMKQKMKSPKNLKTVRLYGMPAYQQINNYVDTLIINMISVSCFSKFYIGDG